MDAADRFDWDDLRYFLHAARARSLAGAARQLGVEHTTIGRRLTALEHALGAALVLRKPDGLQLSPLGEQLVPIAESVERSMSAIADLVASERARVRLAVPSGFTSLFTAHLADLRARHPDLSLELVSGARPVDLERGEADLAIRSGRITDKDLLVRKLCMSGWSLYASEAYLARHPGPIDPDDLGGHELIGFDPSLAKVVAATWIDEHASTATVVLRSREMTDIVAAAASGVGLAVLPCMLGDADPRLTRLTERVVASHSLSLVYRREARLSDHVRAVVRFVTEVFAEHAEAITGAAPPSRQ